MLGELNDEQIDGLLHEQVVGRIGCRGDDGLVYVVPITYAYDGHAVYGHTFDGLKLRLMRANPRVCFEVDRIETLTSWQSVIAWGTFEELTGARGEDGMELLMRRLMPLLPGTRTRARPATSAEPADGAIVYRIVLDSRTGRFEGPFEPPPD